MRVALKFGYDGTKFAGSQRQPGKRTVEGEIIAALEGFTKFDEFKAAGRTDAGVSALGAVIALDTEFSTTKLIRALNARVRDVWFYGYKVVEAGFNPRYALERRYRYFLRDEGQNLEIMENASQLFIGEHDFSNFAKIEEGKNPIRKVENAYVRRKNGMFVLEFSAPNFLWNQIRRMVSAIDRASRGLVELSSIKDALQSNVHTDFGLAPSEALVLVDVKYDFEFEKDTEQNEIAIENIKERIWSARLRHEFLREMMEKIA